MKILNTALHSTSKTGVPAENRPMRFTERDGHILEAIQAYDGLLADYQIQRLFFTAERQCRGRLNILFRHGYLMRPDLKQRGSLPCMVNWLSKKGAAYVAGLYGQDIKSFAYRRQPRWSQVTHDLAVNDFRIDVVQASRRNTALHLEQWIPEGEFWAHPDRVHYADIHGRRKSRLVRPDGYFVIQQGKYVSRLLLELDMATEDNPRFAREKVLPGIAYLRSKAYKKRFGYQSGRWLVVTTSEHRMRNLKSQTEVVAGNAARLFYFTVAEQVQPDTVFTKPIWQRGGDHAPCALFPTKHAPSKTRIPFAMMP